MREEKTDDMAPHLQRPSWSELKGVVRRLNKHYKGIKREYEGRRWGMFGEMEVW